MPSLAEYDALMQLRKENQERERQKQAAALLPRVREVAHKAQTVVDHPGWQWFLDSLETRIKEVEKVRASHVERMIFGKELGQDLERLKIELNTMDAEIKALQYAQSLVTGAIDEGNRIVTGVNGQAAAASIAG